MNDKKNINRLHCLLLKSVTGFWDFPNEKRHESDGYPPKIHPIFFVTDYEATIR